MTRALLPPIVLAAVLAPAHAQTDVERLQRQLYERDPLVHELAGGPAGEHHAQIAPSIPIPRRPAPSGPVPADASRPALERALVRQGGLLLQPGVIELEPAYDFLDDGRRGLAIVQTPAGPQLAERSSARHRDEVSLGLRIGLPRNAQVALRLPYVRTRSNVPAPAAGVDQPDRASGLGDVEAQFDQQFTDDRPGQPALFGALAWKAANGDHRPGLASVGSGFGSLQAGLTAVKRQGPLVFLGGLSYTDFRARRQGPDRLEPGSAVALRLGALLAANPQSSFRLGLELARAARTRINGVAAAGTDTLAGVVEFGLTSLVSRKTSVDLKLGIGVTSDAPRLRIGLALPMQID